MKQYLFKIGAITVAAASMLSVVGCSSGTNGSSANNSSGSSNSNSSTSLGPAGSTPTLSWKGTITMYAQAYTPDVPGVYLAPGSSKLTGFEQAAKAFEKLYPGIKIKFVNSNTYGSNQWYETEAAGGKLPDVTWVQSAIVGTALPNGIFTNLTPYYAQPNPFISGNKKWSDIMNPRILEMIKAPDGNQYVDDGDWVGTAFYYNKDLFKKAGINSAPTTWAQLIADSKQLKAHGIDPGAINSNTIYSWWGRIFNPNALGTKTLNSLLAMDHSVGVVGATDQVKGFENGTLDPSKNPALTAWWPSVKQLLSLWDQSVLEVPVNNTNSSAPSSDSYFDAQKVAIDYSGSWVPMGVQNLAKNKQFDVGAFNIDDLKGTSKYATNLVTSQDVGGPSAAWQFAVSTQKSDSTMTPDKLKAVMAWLEFFSTPKWNQTIVDELGEFVPTFKGAKATAANASLAADLNKPFYSLDYLSNLTAQAPTQINSLFQEYLTGHLSYNAAVQQYEQIATQAVQQYKVKNNVQ
ncbi:ABC transporter substrate-binding protein [Alicyclobacillus fodiniaquatilis]|uniref:ABC transporter substrate-binding protein n=1 Tax=Alicyclobacillus fodiniaquatilis TaxID=1661150 RepID=A0ABW4JLK3_9BACL